MRKEGGHKEGFPVKSVSRKKTKWENPTLTLEPFGSKTKPTGHTALTACPKIQFTFRFLNKYTLLWFRQIPLLCLLLHKYLGHSSDWKFGSVSCCLQLQHVSAVHPAGVFMSSVWPWIFFLSDSCEIELDLPILSVSACIHCTELSLNRWQC